MMLPCHSWLRRGRALLALLLFAVAWRGLGGADPPAVTADLDALLREAELEAPPLVRPALPPAQELDASLWYLRRYQEQAIVTPLPQVPADGLAGRGRPWHELLVRLDDDREFFCKPRQPLGGWDALTLTLRLPPDLPAETQFYLFIKEWDDLWLHVLLPRPTPTAQGEYRFTVPLSGEAARRAWVPRGHQRPWHQLMPDRIAEVGLKLALPKGQTSPYTGTAQVTGAMLTRDELAPRPPGVVYDLLRTPEVPHVGERVELTFRVTHPFRAPYDRRDVDLLGTITTPSGKAVPVRAFYMEDFAYDAARYGQQLVLPQGMPRFALRYTPLEEGEHRLRLAGTLGGEPFTLPDQRFTVQPNLLPWRGYVRPSPHDPRLLAYSVGDEEFWGLGMSVRSPDDTRYVASFPFTAWDYQDLDIYEKLLPQYAANGVKVIEVWMSPWWLALEWIPDAPGNHGIGEMNQWRAWKLDRLLRRCEELDLYLVLVLNNHGKFSAWIDSDWERSPFNRENGGPLETPMEYFSLPVARQAYARLADYLVARWGYSSHLLAWKLFTEIDLTGNNREWYKEPAVKEWHAFAGDYLKRIDPNQHLVTTHWATSYEMVNRDLALIPQLDMLTLDIYYQGSGAEHFFDYLLATSDFLDGMGKPGIITEFGGSPHGDTLPHILHQLHLALWGGFFTRFPVSPCFWWFPLVEEQNLYHEYAAVARFAEGEHRTGSRAYRKRLDEQLFLFELRQPQTRHYWLVDTSYYFSGSLTLRPPLHHSRSIRLTDLPAGTWTAEFWDCRTGTRMGQAEVIATPGAAPDLRLPPFEADLAIKLKATSLPPSPGP